MKNKEQVIKQIQETEYALALLKQDLEKAIMEESKYTEIYACSSNLLKMLHHPNKHSGNITLAVQIREGYVNHVPNCASFTTSKNTMITFMEDCIAYMKNCK
jgi:hypothetical protein